MEKWQDIVRRAYEIREELQTKVDAGEELSAKEKRDFQGAVSLTNKYSLSGRRKRRKYAQQPGPSRTSSF